MWTDEGVKGKAGNYAKPQGTRQWLFYPSKRSNPPAHAAQIGRLSGWRFKISLLDRKTGLATG